MSENIVYIKSKSFAIRIVNLYRYLREDKKEYVMSKQLLRCGTSIGANIAESGCTISEKDFLSKLYVAFKECAETQYWLDILYETSYLNEQEYRSISDDCLEIKKLLSSITKTIREKEQVGNHNSDS